MAWPRRDGRDEPAPSDRRRFLTAAAAADLAPRLVHAGPGDDGFIGLEAAPAEAPLLGEAGYPGIPEKPLFSAAHGRTVIIVMGNRSVWPHAMHVHGHHVRLIEAAGTAPADDAWRDTLLVAPDVEARIAFVADNSSKWMLHCHMLEHQEAGMMTWFEVGAAA